MHIPDAYLSPATEAVAFCVMVPLWSVAIRRTRQTLTTKQVPLLSMGAAFCFAVQMFNIPAVGGTTAHALGSTLLAILVGPWAALLGMTLSLAIQALLFGDGGILTLGANCWDMGFVACFVGYGVYRLASGQSPQGSPRRLISAGVGGYAGTVAASLSAGILLGLQPAIAHDAAGHALYCPFGLNIAVPAMVMSHLLMAGPADGIITMAALVYLWKSFPEFSVEQARVKIGATSLLTRRLLWVLVLTPLGLIAVGDAWGEWDLDKLKEMIGYAPAGIAKSHQLVQPLLPDYGFAGLETKPWQVVGYWVSAILGCALVAGFTRSLLKGGKAKVAETAPPSPAKDVLPDWMKTTDDLRPIQSRVQARWLERTLIKLGATVEKSIGTEKVAHSQGSLQSIQPIPKAIGFLMILVSIGFAGKLIPLIVFLLCNISLARRANVPLWPMFSRVLGCVLFFGGIVAIPMVFQAVTPGPVVAHLFGAPISSTGVNGAVMLGLRLGAGISTAILWNLSTKWFDLLRSLRAFGIPPLLLEMLTLTYRYVFVVMETLSEMVQARLLRQVGAADRRSVRAYAGYGSAILFAKSMSFTEEVHQAMRARNFEGVPPRLAPAKWGIVEVAWIGVGLSSLILVSISGGYFAF